MYKKLAAAYWLIYFSFQTWLALNITLDYNDAFDYLRNARTLAGVQIGFSPIHSPMISCLFVPLQELLDLLGPTAFVRLQTAHFQQMIVTAACFLLFYKFLRLFFSVQWAQAGVILLSLNRMSVHYASLAMSDIPCMLFLLAFFFIYERRSYLLNYIEARWAALALGLCLLMRFNMLVVPFGIWAHQGIIFLKNKRGRSWNAILPMAMATFASVAIFLAGSILVLYVVFPLNLMSSSIFFFRIMKIASANASVPDPLWGYLSDLLAAAGLIPIIAFLWGVRLCFFDRFRSYRFQAAAFVAFFSIMTFLVPHKEARYLFPALPCFYCIVVLGLKDLYARLPRILSSNAKIACVIIFWCTVSAGALNEGFQFFNPGYRSTILQDLIDCVEANRTPDSRIFWSGASYSSMPNVPLFSQGDKNYYLYHIPSQSSLAYMTGIDILSITMEPQLNFSQSERFHRLGMAVSSDLQEGDVVISAPPQVFLSREARIYQENKILIAKFHNGKLKTLATLPKSPGIRLVPPSL